MKKKTPLLARTGSLGRLSEDVIPATARKNYVYSSTFTVRRPLYALLDCKANKSRAIAHVGTLGREVHLCFAFETAKRAKVYSIGTANDTGFLGDANVEFDEVFVAPATSIAIEDFYVTSAKRDSARLIEICRAACKERKTYALVTPGMIVAVLTSGNKYGLFLVKKVTPTSVHVDAYHIWAP
jgi:hypothetical protein